MKTLGSYTTSGAFLCPGCIVSTDRISMRVASGDPQFHGADCTRCKAEVDPDDDGVEVEDTIPVIEDLPG